MDHTILYDNYGHSDRGMEVIYNSHRCMVRVVIHHTNSMGHEQQGEVIPSFLFTTN